MQILTRISIDLLSEEVLEAQFLGRRASFSPSLLRSAAGAIERGRELFAPAAVYDEFPVLGIEGENLIVGADGSSARLRIGPKIDLLAPAGRVLVAVDTIGPALEARVEQLHREGEALAAYMLDSVGVVGLGAVGEAVRAIVERRAAGLGWGVGAALAPGSLIGWPLRGQRELCALLPLEEIGVVLNDSYVLVPHKSSSVLIGFGPGYTASRVGSVCRFCSLSDTCWRRRKDTDDDCPGN
jgi:hypothetical protein